MKKIKVGVIGSGGIARSAHLPNYRKIENVEIIAVADINLEAAKKASEEFAVPHSFANYEELLGIDEIDAVGGKRSSSTLHPYANQTINQLLAEMDGFKSNEGVIVLGATNRDADLDSALLRPGRFDSRVNVPRPDVKGRTELLELYMSKITHSASIDIETLAKLTVGFSGADIQNLVNTAAVHAASSGESHATVQAMFKI